MGMGPKGGLRELTEKEVKALMNKAFAQLAERQSRELEREIESDGKAPVGS